MSTDLEAVGEVAADLGIHGLRRHIFLCADPSEPKCCDPTVLKRIIQEHLIGGVPVAEYLLALTPAAGEGAPAPEPGR